MSPASSLVFVSYVAVLVLLGWLVYLLVRYGHILLYALDYAQIKLLVWWFVRQRHTVVDMFEVSTSPRIALPLSTALEQSVADAVRALRASV